MRRIGIGLAMVVLVGGLAMTSAGAIAPTAAPVLVVKGANGGALGPRSKLHVRGLHFAHNAYVYYAECNGNFAADGLKACQPGAATTTDAKGDTPKLKFFASEGRVGNGTCDTNTSPEQPCVIAMMPADPPHFPGGPAKPHPDAAVTHAIFFGE